MYKKKPFLIVFEGIEGCGKSFQSKKLLRNLMMPTRIYSKIINKIYTPDCGITGIANITGGGLIENIPRIMNKNLGVSIKKNS